LASYREKPFIGFPGFPVSTWVVAKFVLDSLVESYYGLLPQCWQQGKALSGRKIPSEEEVLNLLEVLWALLHRKRDCLHAT